MPGWAAVLLLLAAALALADPDDATDSSDAGPVRSTFHIKSTTVARITGPIKIDGRLDEVERHGPIMGERSDESLHFRHIPTLPMGTCVR